MVRLWNRLKDHWKITSNLQVVIILIAFALSGFSTLYVHRYIDSIFGIDEESSFWIVAAIFILLILPIFNTFLVLWGTLLGQQKFVFRFIKTKINLILMFFKRKI